MALGDYFRDLGGLFKSQEQRDRQRERQRRQAFRRAEIVIGDVKGRLKSLDRDAKAAWEEARDLTKSGQRAAAQRALVKYRSLQVMVARLDQKKFAFEQSLMALEMAGTDNAFASVLSLLASIVDIDPERIDDVLATVDMKRSEQGEVDKLWQKEYERHMERAEGALDDFVPSMEELAVQLEDEAAQEVEAAKPGSAKGGPADRIKEDRARAQELLDEEEEK